MNNVPDIGKRNPSRFHTSEIELESHVISIDMTSKMVKVFGVLYHIYVDPNGSPSLLLSIQRLILLVRLSFASQTRES